MTVKALPSGDRIVFVMIGQRDCSKDGVDLVEQVGAPTLQVATGTLVKHNPPTIRIDDF